MTTIEPSREEIMFHDALHELLTKVKQFKDARMGTISLAIRHDARVGKHVHAGCRMTHYLGVTVAEKE